MEMTLFQKLILAGFFLAMIVGVAIFALQRGGNSASATEVVMWGTIDPNLVRSIDEAVGEAGYDVTINYRVVDEDKLVETVLEALAAGVGPDIVMFPSDRFVDLEDKFQRIPYETLSEAEFRETFVEGAEMFLDYNGVAALPATIDPIVTYWNRDMYSNAAVARPPLYWDEVPALVTALTKTDGTREISQSAVAMGEYANVAHAKQVLQALIMQAGNPLVARIPANSSRSATFDSIMTRSFTGGMDPASAALSFFTQFADPSRDTYSWNRSLRNSTDAFSAGELATYFGYASELPNIQKLNPNLNYDVAPFPQARDAGAKRGFARLYGLGIPKNSKAANSAYTTMLAITSPAGIAALIDGSVLPPVRRDMLATVPGNSWGKTFYEAAFISRGVYDVRPSESNRIFREMIESVTSGRVTADASVSRAEGQIDLVISEKNSIWEE